MLGSRALYHDGWKAVAFHTPPFISYDGTDTRRPFDDDVWELYHVAEDFAEVRDLAAERPEKLAEMQALLVAGGRRSSRSAAQQRAGPLRRHALPPRPLRALRRDRAAPRSDRAELPEPFVHHRGGARHPRRGATDGVIVAHGSHAGGYVAYVQDRRLHYAYNFVGTEITTIAATDEAPDRAGRRAHRLQSRAR